MKFPRLVMASTYAPGNVMPEAARTDARTTREAPSWFRVGANLSPRRRRLHRRGDLGRNDELPGSTVEGRPRFAPSTCLHALPPASPRRPVPPSFAAHGRAHEPEAREESEKTVRREPEQPILRGPRHRRAARLRRLVPRAPAHDLDRAGRVHRRRFLSSTPSSRCLPPRRRRRPRPTWSFADAFYFSVQTMGTIGYGAMYPDAGANNIWSSPSRS